MDDITCTIMIAYHPEIDERALIVRSVEGFATHWMRQDGVWEPLPDEQDALEGLMNSLIAAPENLPLMYEPDDTEDDEADNS